MDSRQNTHLVVVRGQLSKIRMKLLRFLGLQFNYPCESTLTYYYPLDASGCLNKLQKIIGSPWQKSPFYDLCFDVAGEITLNDIDLLIAVLEDFLRRKPTNYACYTFARRIPNLNPCVRNAIVQLKDLRIIFTARKYYIKSNVGEMLLELEKKLHDYLITQDPTAKESLLLKSIKMNLQSLNLKYNDYDDYEDDDECPIADEENQAFLMNELKDIMEILQSLLPARKQDVLFVESISEVIMTLDFIVAGLELQENSSSYVTVAAAKPSSIPIGSPAIVGHFAAKSASTASHLVLHEQQQRPFTQGKLQL